MDGAAGGGRRSSESVKDAKLSPQTARTQLAPEPAESVMDGAGPQKQLFDEICGEDMDEPTVIARPGSVPAPCPNDLAQAQSPMMKANGAGNGLGKLTINNYVKLAEPTRTHYKIVTFDYTPRPGHDLDATFSTNLVVRSVQRKSPLFNYLIVGDQIVEVNDQTPLKVDDLVDMLLQSRMKIRLTVVRPWNTRPPPGPDKNRAYHLPGLQKRVDACTYLIVDVRALDATNELAFDVVFDKNSSRCWVRDVRTRSRGAFAFIEGDRILDCNGVSIITMKSESALMRTYLEAVKKKGYCSFLIERACSLSSSPNPSICATRTKVVGDMGEDAVEIGARESARHAHIGHKLALNNVKNFPKSILVKRDDTNSKRRKQQQKAVGDVPEDPVPPTGEEEDDGGQITERSKAHHSSKAKSPKKGGSGKRNNNNSGKKKFNSGRKKRDKKTKRGVTIEPKRSEISRMPSDADGKNLQKATSRSGVINFVRSYIGR